MGIVLKTPLDEKTDLKKELDVIGGERYRLSGDLNEAQVVKEATDKKVLQWKVTYEDQVNYLNNLAFILGPHMEKIPTNLLDKITFLPGEVRVEVKPIYHQAL